MERSPEQREVLIEMTRRNELSKGKSNEKYKRGRHLPWVLPTNGARMERKTGRYKRKKQQKISDRYEKKQRRGKVFTKEVHHNRQANLSFDHQ